MAYAPHDHLSRRVLTLPLVSDPRGLGRLIREMRERAGLSQRALAALLGSKDEGTIGQYENGKLRPKMDTFVQMSEALGHKVYIRFGDELVMNEEAGAGRNKGARGKVQARDLGKPVLPLGVRPHSTR